MKWEEVAGSSTVRRIGYDHEAGAMGVEFHNGGTYHYADVPHDAFVACQSAESVGKHLHANIKGVYAHTRQGES